MLENGYELSYSSYMTCNRNGEIIGRITCKEKLRYRTLLRDNGIGCLTCIYDTKRIGKKFMPIVRKRQDWGLWLSIIKETKMLMVLKISILLYIGIAMVCLQINFSW